MSRVFIQLHSSGDDQRITINLDKIIRFSTLTDSSGSVYTTIYLEGSSDSKHYVYVTETDDEIIKMMQALLPTVPPEEKSKDRFILLLKDQP